jgi:hypothetical protein
MYVKRTFLIFLAVLVLVGVLLIFTGGAILARWSPFLSTCETIKIGDSLSTYEKKMSQYITDPAYNYMTNTSGATTTISLAEDSGLHLKTWRCQVEVVSGSIISVTVSAG